MTSQTNNLAKTLTKGGLIGVMIALIGAVCVIAWFNYKVTSNHIEHNQQAWEANTKGRHDDSKMISDALIEIAESNTELTTYLRVKLD